MTDETTTEQLAEIDRDMAEIERQVAELVEEAQRADYPQPVQVREGRWRTRNGAVKNIRPCEPVRGAYFVWPWTDGFMTYQDNGRHLAAESDNDLVEYLGPIEPEPQPQAAAIEELRSEVSYVQRLLGESRQRVTQLEELVTSLRTINEAQEKAFTAAGEENTALRNQLAAVKAELASVAADRQQLRVELDAAQQVPADSPELRQLRADLAEVIQERDQHLDSYQRIFGDLETIRETTKAETVEAIVEWLEPVRATIEAADNVQQTMRADNLACDIIRNLPGILRYVVGLNHPEEIE